MTTWINSQFPRPDFHRQVQRHYGLQDTGFPTAEESRRIPEIDFGRVIRCRFIFSGKNDELPSREGAPGGLKRASGFPFPL